MRVEVSLLFAEGHVNANRYPLSKVWFEARIARTRINGMLASEVTLMHAAMVAIMSSKGKEGVNNLNKQLKELRNGN